jgi:hypothetical protein
MTMVRTREAARQCLAGNAAGRCETAALRDHAALPHLGQGARQTLREAEASDRQADWRIASAIGASRSLFADDPRKPATTRSLHMPVTIHVLTERTTQPAL